VQALPNSSLGVSGARATPNTELPR
jgi:hypothetical protein